MKSVLVKVGGSLLTLSDLPGRLRTLFQVLDAEQIVIVVGGGSAADVVRNWDSIHSLSSEDAHWLAIDSMSLTAGLLAQLLPEAELVSDRRSANRCCRFGTIAILDPRPVLDELQVMTNGEVQQLPAGWHCTADSIAAWIATHWQLDAIVLGKSVDASRSEVRRIDVSTDAVDTSFKAIVAGQLPVYWCNVRDSPESVLLWRDVSAEDEA